MRRRRPDADEVRRGERLGCGGSTTRWAEASADCGCGSSSEAQDASARRADDDDDGDDDDDDDRRLGSPASPRAPVSGISGMLPFHSAELGHAAAELAIVARDPKGRLPRPRTREPRPDLPQGVPIPPWEPGGFFPECDIQRPPPPTGARNPDVGVFDGDIALDPPQYPSPGPRGPGGAVDLVSATPWSRRDASFPPVPPPAPRVDQILGPERPLCPPSMAFDYAWQSCWPKDVPHAPPPDGSTWPHACRCPPGETWLAAQGRCWTRGSIPGSQNQAADSFLGHGPPLNGADDFAPDPVGIIEMPFRTEEFDVTEGEVIATLGEAPSRWDIEVIRRIGIEDQGDWEWAEKCHTQGIVHTGDFVITSCMTVQGNHADEKEGFLQFYKYDGIHFFESVYRDGENSQDTQNIKVLPHPHPHAVPGQMVRGTEVTSHIGVTFTGLKDVCLFPVGSEGSPGDASDGGEPTFDLRIFDQFGNEYPSMGAVLPGGYACGALFSQVISGASTVGLFLLVIEKEAFSVYKFPWNGRTREFGAPIEVITRKDGTTVEFDGVTYLYKNLLKPHYQAACVFRGIDGLYLVATHDRWMDTYRIEVRWTEEGDGEYYLHLDKIARVKYPNKPGTVEKIFFNGTAIQKLGSRSMRLWASPWDYRMRLCWPMDPSTKCTYLWHWTKEF